MIEGRRQVLDSVIKFSVKNKTLVGIMTLALVVWGAWSVSRLSVDALPDITNNQVQIITICPTLAGQEVEQIVTFPIEQSIANLPDLEETRSISRFGLSVITAVFKDEVDIYFARQLISQKLDDIAGVIPDDVGKPTMAPVSTGLGEVYQYILRPKRGSEHKYDAKDLRTLQDWVVARHLNGTEGVAEINSFGGEVKQYEVAVNPSQLRAMGVSIAEILNALEKNNQNSGGAYIDKKPNAYFIRSLGMVGSLKEIESIVVKKSVGGVPVLIKDLAMVRFGNATRYGAMTYNGKTEVVGGVIMMLKGANSNEVVGRVKDKVRIIQKLLPSDVVLEPFLDRTDLVGSVIDTVKRNLLEGALIVVFVLLLFLGNLRAGLIVASAIPLSMLFALSMMNVFGVSANLASLGAIDFGLIVDGAVIIVEATLHHLGLRKSMQRLSQKEIDDEVIVSASKIRKSAAFGEIIILVVYIPILTLAGIEGKIFAPMAKAVGFAIFGALLLSLTYIPMMCALCLSKKTPHRKTMNDRVMEALQKRYKSLLQKALSVKYIVVCLTVVLLLVSLAFSTKLGSEFIPQMQEGSYAFHCILPEGSSLSQSLETSMQASRIIKNFDEVEMVVGKTGAAEIPADPMPPEATDLVIVLKPRDQWKNDKNYKELASEIYEKLKVIPGVFFEKNQPIQMRFNELMTGIRQDVAVRIFGENMDTLAHYIKRVSTVIQSVKGATSPQIERVGGLQQIVVEYDRIRMGNYGLTVKDVNNIIKTAFAGTIVGQVFENERRFDLVVRLDSVHRGTIEDLRNLMIPTNTGVQVPVSQVGKVSYKLGPAQISHEATKRRIVIGFNVSGRDVGTVVKDIQKKLEHSVKLPQGYYFTYGGQFENLQKATDRLIIAVPASLLLIFILLYITFRSLKQATLIFTAIPMSATGGIFALLLRDMPFSVSAGIGFIALFGVAVLNGIVLIGTFNQLKKEKEGDMLSNVLEGAKLRLRPVLMTAAVASFGFLPMAFNSGIGAEIQKPLATVVIGGLASATILTLFVLPLLYVITNSKNKLKPKGGSKFTKTLITSAFLMLGLQANAQSKKIDTAEEAIKIALDNNENIKAKALQIEGASELLKATKELPKAAFLAQVGQYNGAYIDQSFQIAQTIPFPTLFSARKKLALSELKERELQSDLSALDLKAQIRTLFYEIQYLKYNEKQLRYLVGLYDDLIEVNKTRYKAGDIRHVDVSIAEAKKGDILIVLKQNDSYLKSAHQTLQALLNSPEEITITESEAFEPLQLSALPETLSVEQNPSVKLLYQNALIVENTKKTTKAEALPDFTIGYANLSVMGYQDVGVGAARVQNYFGADHRFSFVMFGVGIPFTFGASKARVHALEYNRQQSEAQARQLQKELTARLRNAINQYRYDVQNYEYYKNEALPNAEEIISTSKMSYHTGDITYEAYLEALRTATDIRMNYLKGIQQVNQSIILIYTLINR